MEKYNIFAKLKHTNIAKRGKKLWRGLKDKTEWEQKAIKQMEEYNKAVKEYEANGGSNSVAKRRKLANKLASKKAKRKDSSEEEEDDESV
ncbi:high mobility group protein Z-like [Drosophila willistoni]|uniref:high mobility group protein Z-like n=1 Tax=Drosophila willistoni TaxID=7260 RepID=UPI001F075EFF|nr:high mobility group protein Z-like [Drosophila willistoni]